MAFQLAERSHGRFRIGLFGPSGSGKTLSSLMLAAGISMYEAKRRGKKFGKVLMIDTERDRSSLYVGHASLPKGFRWHKEVIKAPFLPRKYYKAVLDAIKQKFDVVIIDSLSHAWAGMGGMLDMQEDHANRFMAWRKIGKEHNLLIDTITQSDAHVIATCRTKMEYIMENDEEEKGKKIVKKKGMAPVFRDGLEYEFMLTFDIEHGTHIATPSKDNTSIFDTVNGAIKDKINIEYGAQLCDWLYETEDDDEDEDDVPNAKKDSIKALEEAPQEEEEEHPEEEHPEEESSPNEDEEDEEDEEKEVEENATSDIFKI